MLQPTYPGVYIQEVPSGVHTITGVATAVTAFLGRTIKGPINRAVRLHSLADFLREFGDGHRESSLGPAMRLFFANGGGDCYLVRVAHNPSPASIRLLNGNEIPADRETVLTVTARDAGRWGNHLYLTVDYDTDNPDETFNLSVVHEEGGRAINSERFEGLSMDPDSPRYAPDFVTASSKLVRVESSATSSTLDGYSESRRVFANSAIGDDLEAMIHPVAPTAVAKCRFDINVDEEGWYAIDLSAMTSLEHLDGSGVAAALEAEINGQLASQGSAGVVGLSFESFTRGSATYGVLRVESVSTTSHSVRIRRAASRDLAAALMLGIDQGGVEVVRYGDKRPMPNATVLTGSLNELAALDNTAFTRLAIAGAAAGSIDLGTSLQTTSSSSPLPDPTAWYRDGLPSSTSDHSDGIREKLRLMAVGINAAVAGRTDLALRAEVWGYHLALIPTGAGLDTAITFSTSSGGGGSDIGTSGSSALFTDNTRGYVLGNAGTSSFQDGPGDVGLDDDGGSLNNDDIIGDPTKLTGMYALDLVDIFNLLVIPADEDIDELTHQQLWGLASTYCQGKRAFLLVDPPDAWTRDDRPVATSADVNGLRALIVKENAAVYYPKVRFMDKGRPKTLGPAPLIAGLMARIDSARGVWKAPAGIEADLRGILALEVTLTDQENGVLNKLGVNCLRGFPSGFVSWGARTLAGTDAMTSEWKYVPIRRLALFLEESLFRGSQWVVFEPNDEPLWAKIRMNLGAFMKGLFRQGAFQGTTPDQAYYVKCDAETTTQADRNLGIVNIEVGFAPLKPAEFVIIKIQQIAGELA